MFHIEFHRIDGSDGGLFQVGSGRFKTVEAAREAFDAYVVAATSDELADMALDTYDIRDEAGKVKAELNLG